MRKNHINSSSIHYINVSEVWFKLGTAGLVIECFSGMDAININWRSELRACCGGASRWCVTRELFAKQSLHEPIALGQSSTLGVYWKYHTLMAELHLSPSCRWPLIYFIWTRSDVDLELPADARHAWMPHACSDRADPRRAFILKPNDILPLSSRNPELSATKQFELLIWRPEIHLGCRCTCLPKFSIWKGAE